MAPVQKIFFGKQRKITLRLAQPKPPPLNTFRSILCEIHYHTEYKILVQNRFKWYNAIYKCIQLTASGSESPTTGAGVDAAILGHGKTDNGHGQEQNHDTDLHCDSVDVSRDKLGSWTTSIKPRLLFPLCRLCVMRTYFLFPIVCFVYTNIFFKLLINCCCSFWSHP